MPDSATTHSSRLSSRPTKRRALTPTTTQAASLDALFAKPSQEIHVPTASSTSTSASHGYQPPEIVTNVQGSSAGAGSGEFHVYKASRRREYERLAVMEEESRREREGAEFEKEREERLRADEERTRRKREKRMKKMKGRKGKGGGGGGAGGGDNSVEEEDGEKGKAGGIKANVVARRLPAKDGDDQGGDKDEKVHQGDAQPQVVKAESDGLLIVDED